MFAFFCYLKSISLHFFVIASASEAIYSSLGLDCFVVGCTPPRNDSELLAG